MVFKLNNELVFPNPVPPLINILYGWSEICGQFSLSYFMFPFVTSPKLIIFCIGSLYCCTYILLSYLLDLCLFDMQIFHRIN